MKNKNIFDVLVSLYPDLKQVIFFSLFVNILVLAPSWYMLQVYDRVLNSQNLHTLAMLTIVVILAFLVLEFLEWIRSRILLKASHKIESTLREDIFENIFKARVLSNSNSSFQAISDLKILQEFVASPVTLALIDIPFSVITIILIFYINSSLGWLSMLGIAVIALLTLSNKLYVQPPLIKANKKSIEAHSYVSSAIKNSQSIESMGMLSNVYSKWRKKQTDSLFFQAVASDSAALNSTLSKLTQFLQGSLLLGLGCWLTLDGEINIGGSMMIVASILGSRMMIPYLTLVSSWKLIIDAQDSMARLNNLLQMFPESPDAMPLPPPNGNLSVEAISATPPNSKNLILKNITFKLNVGESLAIIGPSGSGKSTLAKVIMGIWPVSSGVVRLDGADIFRWDKSNLGPYLGYLPQNVELFDGTIAENISRFGPVDMSLVEEAAKVASVDTFISQLENGYDTKIGIEGSFLSGGQKQRIALARSVYGMPRLLVLDEPNSNLDQEGDLALIQALDYMKKNMTTIVIITHRASILGSVNNILLIVEGQVGALGPKDQVLSKLKTSNT